MFSGYSTFSLFDPIPQERNHLKYPPVTKILQGYLICQTLPFGSVFRRWPAVRSISGRTDDAHRSIELNDASDKISQDLVDGEFSSILAAQLGFLPSLDQPIRPG
jgi:hypothetical protein